ncbi:hypothetical protein IAQ61_001616, partial [Plenodomus lingam]
TLYRENTEMQYLGCFRRNVSTTNNTPIPPFGPPDRQKAWYTGPWTNVTFDQTTVRGRCENDIMQRDAFQYATIAEGGVYWSCGIQLQYDLGPNDPTMCNVPCARNTSMACGGMDWMDVWRMPGFVDYYGLGGGSTVQPPNSQHVYDTGTSGEIVGWKWFGYSVG